MENCDKKPSTLAGALRRLGRQMQEIEDIDGSFSPFAEQPRRDRIYGTLQTHDATVRIGFDSARVTLPALTASRMKVSGKVWLDEKSSGLILMVREYKLIDKSF